MWNTALVLGMHRSGTSAVATVAEHLGLSLGTNSRRLLPAADNPLGFSELADVMEFNDRILSRTGWSWDYVPVAAGALSWDEAEVQHARSLITDDPSGVQCLKDPRVSITLPLWRAALLDRASGVVVIRDPREVVWSLVVRNRFTPAHAASLWIAYNLHLARGASGLDLHLLRFDQLVQSPVNSITGLGEFLVSTGSLDGLDDDKVQIAAKSIDQHLRRETFPVWLTDHPIVTEAVRIYRGLSDEFGAEVIEERLSRRNRRLEHICSEVLDLHRAAVHTGLLRSQAESNLIEQRVISDTLSGELRAAQAEVDGLRLEIEALRREHAVVLVDLETRRSAFESLAAESLPELKSDVRNLLRLIETTAERNESIVVGEGSSTRSMILNLLAVREDRESEVQALLDQDSHLRARIGALENSTSLRLGMALTAPGRFLKSVLRRLSR